MRKHVVFLLVVMMLAATHASGLEISDISDWTYNPATGHWYGLTPVALWTDAEDVAVLAGGHLVTINDGAENQWLMDNFASLAGDSLYLGMGFNDIASEGTWEWASGEAVTYTNWLGGEPNDAASGEDYGLIIAVDAYGNSSGCLGLWNDGTNHANGIRSIVETSAPVPEPATMLMLGCLGAGMATTRKMRRRKND